MSIVRYSSSLRHDHTLYQQFKTKVPVFQRQICPVPMQTDMAGQFKECLVTWPRQSRVQVWGFQRQRSWRCLVFHYTSSAPRYHSFSLYLVYCCAARVQMRELRKNTCWANVWVLFESGLFSNHGAVSEVSNCLGQLPFCLLYTSDAADDC